MDMSYIGERIRLRRKELNLTINQINELTGISSGNLSEIETGKKLPSSPALISLSNALKCSIDWLLKENYSEYLNSDITLSAFEHSFIREIRTLSPHEQQELYEIAKLKINMKRESKNLEILSNSHQDTDIKLA